MLAVALGGCAGTTGQRLSAAPKQSGPGVSAQGPVQGPTQRSAQAGDLDSLAYGRTAASARAQAIPPSAAAAQAHAVVPVAAPAPMPAIVPACAPAEAFEGEPPYRLDTGDRLRVVVFGQDGLTNSYVVDAGGAITMPLIKAVTARGLTTQELARTIGERLRGGFVREPHVAIEVEIYRPFFILGEVTVPGQYAYVPQMTVENAVAIAGGFTPRAYRWDIRIDRPCAGGILRQTVPPLTRVRAGDTITVTERWF